MIGLIMLFIAIAGAVAVHQWIDDTIRTRSERRALCPHGVIGGRSNMQCGICRDLIASELLAAAAEEAKSDQRARTLTAAIAFNKAEASRIHRSRLSRAEHLRSLGGRGFEDAVAELYRRMGFEVTQTPYAGDRGRDAVLRKGATKYVLECKCYADGRAIGRPALQILYASMLEVRAKGAFFVTTGRFSKHAAEYARANSIELVDAGALAALFARYYPPDGSPDIAQGMCSECGDIVRFDPIDQVREMRCRHGHSVRNPVEDPLSSLGHWQG
jgi:HJR/Mrr/RecB family endonuclease